METSLRLDRHGKNPHRRLRPSLHALDATKLKWLRKSAGAAIPEAAPETLHTSAAVQNLLLAGVERMAVRADFQVNVFTQSRSRLNHVPAAAGCRDFLVFGMNVGLHRERTRLEEGREVYQSRNPLQPATCSSQ